MTKLPAGLLLQFPTSPSPIEIAACRAGALLQDLPTINCAIQDLAEYADRIRLGYMPVGSVEFVREAMIKAGIEVPLHDSYPAPLHAHLRRHVWRCHGLPTRKAFIKPAQTCKLFTGFVYDPALPRSAYSAHDAEQWDRATELPSHEPLWASEPVRWMSEWRYYVLDGQLIGQGRYDMDGPENAPMPDVAVLRRCVQAMPGVRAMAIDLGVLECGQTALVEWTDAWAVGLYGRSLQPRQYLSFLAARWQQIAAAVVGPHGQAIAGA